MAEQCKGTTKSGARCKMTGTFSNGYCHRHQSQSGDATPEPPAEKKKPVENTTVKEEAPAAPTPPPPSDSWPETEEEKTSGVENMLPAVIVGVLVFLLLVLFTRKRSVRYIKL